MTEPKSRWTKQQRNAQRAQLAGGVELRTQLAGTRETRLHDLVSAASGFELRTASATTTGGTELVGTPMVYNQATTIFDQWGSFRETIMPGVVSQLLHNTDTRFLFNHEGMPLARTASGTLKLHDASSGLGFSAQLDARSNLANDLLVAIERGDVSAMSVGFVVAPGGDHWNEDKSARQIFRMEKLLDISAVSFPAYGGTSIELASSKRRPKCKKCKGQGTILMGNRTCPQCNGTGLAGPDGTQNAPDPSPANAQDGTGTRKLLTAAEQHALPDHKFAFIGDAGKTRKLPIHDPEHVRNAIARFGSTSFPTPAAKAMAAKKVLDAAAGFGITVDPTSAVATAAAGGSGSRSDAPMLELQLQLMRMSRPPDLLRPAKRRGIH